MKVKPFSIAGNILFSSKKYISSQRGGTWTRCKRQNRKKPNKTERELLPVKRDNEII